MSTCWPALWPSQPETSRTRLLVLGVSGTTSTTSARRQESRRGCTTAILVSPVTLLAPGVPVVVVAQGLPEARLVAICKPQASNPLCTLPEIEMRDEQTGGTAMLGLEWFLLVGVSHPCLATYYVFDRQVRRVAPITEGDRVSGS